MNSISKLWKKLKNPVYRKAFVDAEINIGIPFQVRALAKARGWTQGELAEKAGMRQPSISKLMSPGDEQPNIRTLRRLADAFDCGLAVRFVPFSELSQWSEEFDPESFDVNSFATDSIPSGVMLGLHPEKMVAPSVIEFPSSGQNRNEVTLDGRFPPSNTLTADGVGKTTSLTMWGAQ